MHNASCGEGKAGTLRALSKKEIKVLGGEAVTRQIKAFSGGSLSDLRINNIGEVYAVRKGAKMGSFVGLFRDLKDQYK